MPFLDSEIEEQKRRNLENRVGIPLERERQTIGKGLLLEKETSKESITKSIETTTQEMDTITTLKKAIANYLLLDDIYDYEENTTEYYCLILGRLEMSLIRRKQSLDEDRKALLELT